MQHAKAGPAKMQKLWTCLKCMMQQLLQRLMHVPLLSGAGSVTCIT